MVAMLALFSGCAGSKSSSAESGSGESGSAVSSEGSAGGSQASGSTSAKAAPPKEDVDSAKVKKAQDAALDQEKDNHEIRHQIFDAKNKLGMPTDQSAQ